jgi:hypothetical protein
VGYEKILRPEGKQSDEDTTPVKAGRLSEDSERFGARVVEKLGPTTFEGIVAAAITKPDVIKSQFNEYASRTGMEPAEFAQNYARVENDLREQANSHLAAVGVDADAVEGFLDWAQYAERNAFENAQLALVLHDDARPLRTLGKRFLAKGQEHSTGRLATATYSDADIETATFASGITAKRVNGKLILSVPGKGDFIASEAVRLGVVKVSRA